MMPCNRPGWARPSMPFKMGLPPIEKDRLRHSIAKEEQVESVEVPFLMALMAIRLAE
jgi:hypothetical protein